MLFYEFEEDDVFVNTLRAYPLYEFYIYSGSIYFDNSPKVVGQNTTDIQSVDANHISLYEYNIDRSSNYIYPFIIKGDDRHCFRKITRENFTPQ